MFPCLMITVNGQLQKSQTNRGLGALRVISMNLGYPGQAIDTH